MRPFVAAEMRFPIPMRALTMRLMLITALTLVGCSSDGLPPSGSGDSGAPPDMGAPGMPYRFVVNQMTLPRQKTDFAIDLNGDGAPDNQIGDLFGALLSQGLDEQPWMDAAIAGGTDNELLKLVTNDQTLQNGTPVGVTAYRGADGKPDFSGNGTFAIDGHQPPADFSGALHGGNYSSENPATTMHPVALPLRFLFVDAAPVDLLVDGAHIQFTTGRDAATNAPGLVDGQIHGSIKKKDLDDAVIPWIAALLTRRVAPDCGGGATCYQIESIFDIGGCVNPDGTMAKALDDKIDYCEVAQNKVIMAVLAPDVQIYDAQGHYAPNPANTQKDSVSLGLAFTAVRASF